MIGRLFLGIEIGGTKLQLGVGRGDGSEFVALERHDVSPEHGANGILEQIEKSATALQQKYSVQRIGYGFGGPVDSSGRVIKSHQIEGWDGFPLAEWTQQTFRVPAVVGNDCDVASLAEARFGAGQGNRTVFYITVGTGIGGGLVVDGKVHGGGRPAAAEIGHLRPGLHDDRPDATVESIASGWGIAATARARISGEVSPPFQSLRVAQRHSSREQLHQQMASARQADDEYIADLMNRCDGELDNLTAKAIGQAAAEGNEVAREVLDHSSEALGWAIAQVITLIAPDVVVVGGGVSLMGEQLFYAPLRQQIARYVFPPLADSFEIAAPRFDELVVVQGATTLAADNSE